MLQQKLVREEEQATGASSGRIRDHTVAAKHGQRKPRSRTHANQSVTKKRFPRRQYSDEPCWGCNQKGHILRFCNTTSEADKKRIYEMRRNRKERQQQPNTSLKQPPKDTGTASPATGTLPRRGQLPTPTKRAQKDVKKVTFSKDSGRTKEGTSHAHAAAQAPTRKKAHAGMVARISEDGGAVRLAWCSVAGTERAGPQLNDGPAPDPYDVHPPEISPNEVLPNYSSKIVFYEDSVLLDSGASDCMTYTFQHLDMIRTAHVDVCLADGTAHSSDYQGLMRISVNDVKTNKRVVVPMLDTLLVSGLRTVLWSVSALSQQGHTTWP